MAHTLILPGNAVPANVLIGTSFSAGVNYGAQGSMPNNGALTLTPGASAQSIPAGYHNGSGIVPAVAVPAANVLTGTTIAGTAGTMPKQANGARPTSPDVGYGSAGGMYAKVLPNYYYEDNVYLWAPNSNMQAANIRRGYPIYNLAGTAYGVGDVIQPTSLQDNIGGVGAVNLVFPTPTNLNTPCVEYDSSGNIYLCVNGTGLYKYNSSGGLIWSFAASVVKVAVDNTNGFVYTVATNAVGIASVWKLNASNGAAVWIKSDVANPVDISFDTTQNVYVAYANASGTCTRKINSAGTTVWSKTDVFNASCIDVCSDGSRLYVGYNPSALTLKLFRALDSGGTEVWAKLANSEISTSIASCYGIRCEKGAGIYNVYVCLGGTWIRVIKYDLNQQTLWSTPLGQSNGHPLSMDSQGYIWANLMQQSGSVGYRLHPTTGKILVSCGSPQGSEYCHYVCGNPNTNEVILAYQASQVRRYPYSDFTQTIIS